VLISGAPGVPPARATVLGAGRAGANAAVALAGMGAQVNVLDIDTDKVRRLDERGLSNITTVYSSIHSVEHYVGTSDVTVGAVLVVGAAAPSPPRGRRPTTRRSISCTTCSITRSATSPAPCPTRRRTR
jgi:alanine dehydrogenase